jgi:tetratricopeptide (TPR) repeat protein
MIRLPGLLGPKRLMGILLVVSLLLLASSGVFAQWEVPGPDDAVAGNEQDSYDGIVMDYGEFVFGWLGDICAVALNILISPFKYLILWNPDANAMRPLVEGIVNLLAPVYIVAIMLSGIYFLFASVSPAGRARAKNMIQKLILSMVLVTLSMPMYNILLNLSEAISQRILAGLEIQPSLFLGFIGAANLAAVALVSSSTLGLGLVMPVVVYLGTVTLAATVVGLRAFLVYLMAALFPITLFLYFFDYTKGFGEKLLNYTMAAIFTQVVQAMVLAIAIISVNAAGDNPDWITAYFMMLIGEGAFLMIILSPLITLGLMSWIGGAVGAVGSVVAFMPVPGANIIGGAMTAAGGVAAGMGPGGLIAGGTVAGLGGAYYQRSQSLVPPRNIQQADAFDERTVGDAEAHSSWVTPPPEPVPPEEVDERLVSDAHTRYGGGMNRPPGEPEHMGDIDDEQRAINEGRARGSSMGGGLESGDEFAERAAECEARGDDDGANNNWEKAAKEYEKYDNHQKAAKCYEKYGNLTKSAEAYEKAAENNAMGGQTRDAAENLEAAAKRRNDSGDLVNAAKDRQAAAKRWGDYGDSSKAINSLGAAAQDMVNSGQTGKDVADVLVTIADDMLNNGQTGEEVAKILDVAIDHYELSGHTTEAEQIRTAAAMFRNKNPP